MPTFTRHWNAWHVVAVVMTLCSLCLFIALISVVATGNEPSIRTCGPNGNSDDNAGVIDDSEPDTPGPFHDLTTRELEALRSYLESDPDINATKLSSDSPLDSSAIRQSYVSVIDLYPPPKSHALAFLEQGKPQPVREALVVLFRGDKSPAVVEERICGPLPDVTSCRMLTSSKRRNPVEFSLRPFNMLEFRALIETVLQGEVENKIGHILRDSFGISYANCDDGPCLDFFTSPVATGLVKDITQRRMWVWANYPVNYYLLHPVDFGLLAVMDAADPAAYTVDKVWYAGRLYQSMDDLISGYNKSSIPTKKRQMPQGGPEVFSSLHLRGEAQPKRPQRPPQLVEPDGKRYSLSGRKVEYLGWQFNLRMSTLSGPQLFDVRFKGDRVAYEVALNEIIVFYSAHNPMHQVTDVADSAGYLGTMVKSLVPGADCPDSATLLSNTLAGQLIKGPVRFANTWCLFEQNSGLPLRRHVGYRFVHGSFYGGMLDSHLTLRTILTVGNYDYVIDFSFHQNGVMDTRVSSTGYLMVSPYSKEESPYGFRIEEHILGNLHHHMFHFKVDMDVGGARENRYSTLGITPDKTKLTTDTNMAYYQTRVTSSLKRKERDALFKYNFNKPMHHIVHNDKNKTKHGEIRGYSIVLNGMSKQLVPEGRNNERTIPWARHQLAVTRHKEDERSSSSTYAMWDSQDPVVDFSKFYDDNEDIVDQDIVMWVSMGLHHIPRTEDLPLTATTGTKLSFSLSPFNYFQECPSMGSRDAMRIEHKDPQQPSKGVRFERYGRKEETCALPASSYDKQVQEDPDVALETSGFLGLL